MKYYTGIVICWVLVLPLIDLHLVDMFNFPLVLRFLCCCEVVLRIDYSAGIADYACFLSGQVLNRWNIDSVNS